MVTAAADPASADLIDRIFEYILQEFPDMQGRIDALKKMTREEFSGLETYVAHRSPTERQQKVQEVMRLFNGRNAREVARRLQISRATVYRLLKTSGR